MRVPTAGSVESIKTEPSVWGVLWAPDLQWERIRVKPVFGGALAVLALAETLFGALTGSLLSHNPAVAASLLQAGFPEAWLSPFLALLIGLFSLIGIVVNALIASSLTWLMMKGLGGQGTFRQLFSLQTHLLVLMVLQTAVGVIGLMVTDGWLTQPPSSLAAYIPVEGGWSGLLMTLDLFMIWRLLLLARGMRIICRLSVARSWVVAGLLFLLDVIVNTLSSS
ncbi:YIP1 family protein [Polycladomyces subterraneus]|uniref:YIP1 family protein n=1 Tax=Polycladomyces subterraneus TaxID=1016997 RepID=A0ABT8ING5_9BACL|nr:YIP1 family protein [Polycladomyces subterraneus]MDN4594336.1 YIP1 family protein [Polycladomyces subterraneus]